MSLAFALFLLFTPVAHAQTSPAGSGQAASSTPGEQADTAAADALAAQAEQTAQQINALKNEIDQLQIQLNNVSSQKQTLQSAIKSLDLNIQKLTKSITLTNTQIAQKDREITRLSGGIATTTSTIGTTREQVAASLRNLAQVDEEPLAASLLAGGTLSDFFNQAVALGTLRDELQNKIEDLSHLKSTLQSSKNTAEQSRAQLAGLKTQLNQQKQGLALSRQSQSELLAKTKNQESSYQALIAQKQAQEASLELALLDLKSQYNVAADPNDYPRPTPGLLQWPVSGKIIITQYFGNTPFSQANPSVYGGRGHNAIDLGVPIGTPLHAALFGIVSGTGNTDTIAGCYSFGKWVLIRHSNGLSTMYSHLSQISVTPGQTVGTGQLIGYSGMTGYATGPHLHFGVYVSAVTKIIQLGQATKKSLTPCHLAVMPVPPVSGYLNPLNYLPAR